MAGLDNTGFTIKTLQEIEAEINDILVARFGSAVNLLSSSIFGNYRDISANTYSDLWEKAEDVYNQLTVNGSGQNLDLVAALSGKRRTEATEARITDFALTVSNNLTLPAGTLFSKDGDVDVKFSLDEELNYTTYVGPGNEVVRVDVTAVTAGEISVNQDSITVIDNPTADLVSVTNDATSVFFNGDNEESDAELRSRIQNDPFITTEGTDSGVRRAILNLNETRDDIIDIENALVIDNEELTTDGDGRPGKSFEAVVYYIGAPDADTDLAIAQSIANSKPDGVKTVTTTGSSITQTITLDGGNTRDITFSRPSEQRVYLSIDLTVEGGASAIGSDLADDLVEWGNNLGLSGDVVVFGRDSISNILNEFAGAAITDYEIGVSLTPGPTPGVDDSNIVIGETEISTWLKTDIIIGDI